jgi:HSP20 family protein
MSRSLARSSREDPWDTWFGRPWLMFHEDDDRLKESSIRTWAPSTDVSETDTKIKIVANLPGMKKEDVKLELDEDTRTLRIFGEHKQEKREDNERFHSVERQFGKFERTIRLPQNADLDNINAKVEHGVLNVEIPKVEPKSKTRAVNVL